MTTKIRFKLSSVFYLLTLAGLMLGWYVDRSLLQTQATDLNYECAELFRSQNVEIEMHFQNGEETHDFSRRGYSRLYIPRFLGLYDAFSANDRARFRKERFPESAATAISRSLDADK